jgi:hypothetical protein
MSRRFELLTASPRTLRRPDPQHRIGEPRRRPAGVTGLRGPAPAGPRIPDSRRGRICAGHWPRLVPVGSCQIAACELAAGPSAVRTRLRGTASDQPATRNVARAAQGHPASAGDRHRNLELVARFTAKPTGDTTTITVATTDPERGFHIELTPESVTFAPATPTASADVKLPAEASWRASQIPESGPNKVRPG